VSTIVEGYHHFGGASPDLGALKNILEFYGEVNPHTGEPFSEAMLLGLGGGVGVIYFTFDFDEMRTMYVGTRDVRKAGIPGYAQWAAERIGARVNIQESGGVRAAESNLRNALADGKPAMVWLDMASLSYSGLPPEMIKYFEHIAVVYGLDDETAYMGDRAKVGLTIPARELAAARSAITMQKNRIMTIEPSTEDADLRRGIVEGIRDCCNGMLNPVITNFGLKALEKWATRLTDTKDKQGWPKMFPRGGYLFDALQSTYTWIELHGTGGSAGRNMYADFLDEAAEVLGDRGLRAVADEYRHCAALWSELTYGALPDAVPLLREARELKDEAGRLFVEQGNTGTERRLEINRRIVQLREEAARDFPLTEAETIQLLEDLQQRVLAIHSAERNAVTMLQMAAEPVAV
jgi:hypothetical protein